MKRALMGLVLAVILASPVLAGHASITAGDGPFVFGQSYSREEVVAAWTPQSAHVNHFAKAECFQGGTVVYQQYNSLEYDTQAGFTFGPTRSWVGGAASCRLSLVNIDSVRTLAQSDTFEVGS